MAEAGGHQENGSLPTGSGFPTGLFHNFFSGDKFPGNPDGQMMLEKNGANEEAVAEEVELSLGLSLNGRFGVEPEKAHKLERSASISNLVLSGENNRARAFPAAAADPPLTRTTSLPAETALEAEEYRKRKELQSLRRMEAKKKRLEKLKNGKDKVDMENPPPRCEGNLTVSGNIRGPVGSNGISGFEGQPLLETCKILEATTPSVHVLELEQKLLVNAGPATNKPAKPDSAPVVQAKAELRTLMQRMPSVSTRVDGPSGRKIDGFLYRYQKGEEASIVCVCHGSFLSPAEFVKHGGGGDVANPLRHIIITPSVFE